jgi:hypothetical protein
LRGVASKSGAIAKLVNLVEDVDAIEAQLDFANGAGISVDLLDLSRFAQGRARRGWYFPSTG